MNTVFLGTLAAKLTHDIEWYNAERLRHIRKFNYQTGSRAGQQMAELRKKAANKPLSAAEIGHQQQLAELAARKAARR